MSRNSGTPTKVGSKFEQLAETFLAGDLLFGVESDREKVRRTLLQEAAPNTYLTIDQINQRLEAGMGFDPNKVNQRNQSFLAAYTRAFSRTFKKLDDELMSEEQIRRACQLAINLLVNGQFKLKIHFIIDGLLKLEDITSSQYLGFTSAEFRTLVRAGKAGKIAGKIVLWFRGNQISFEQLLRLVPAADHVTGADRSPISKQPRRPAEARFAAAEIPAVAAAPAIPAAIANSDTETDDTEEDNSTATAGPRVKRGRFSRSPWTGASIFLSDLLRQPFTEAPNGSKGISAKPSTPRCLF